LSSKENGMTTLTIDIRNEEEEKVLLEFLNKSNFSYRTDDDYALSREQEEEILSRERAYENGEMKSYPWEEVKKRFARP